MTCKVLTWNIGWSRRDQGEYKTFSLNNRIDRILKLISKTDPYIMFIQEIHHSKLEYVREYLKKDYWLTYMRHSSRDEACFNLICIHRSITDKYQTFQEVIPSFSNTYNGERSIITCMTCLEIGDTMLVNIHSPMALKIRTMVTEQLSTYSQKYKKMLVCGDFNTFSDAGGAEQVQKICESTNLINYNDEIPTFRAFPYDKFQSTCPPMPLDHVFYKGLSQPTGLQKFGQDKDLVSDNVSIEFENQKYFLSDHLMVTFDINIL